MVFSNKYRQKNFKVGLTHGVFDLLHIGHVEYFRAAKKICDKLIVSVTTDKFVNKGDNRPAFSIRDRVKMLKSIKYIDEVIVSNYSSAVKVIKKVKPNFYIKGKDYKDLVKNPTKNLKLEIDAIKSVKGKFILTDTRLKSSSKILNENYNYLDKDILNFLKTINKDQLQLKLKEHYFKNNKRSVLIVGEPIIDVHSNVNVLGKSQKSNVVSTNLVNNEEYGGGIILVANLLAEFVNKVDILTFSNNFNNKILRKHLNKKVNTQKVFSNDEKIIIKKRFVDNYNKGKLFQINENEKNNLFPKSKKLYLAKLKKIIKNYDQVIVFDYGYGYLFDECRKLLKNNSKKVFVNCQTNSSNYGFNLLTKYEKANIACVDEIEFRLSVGNKHDEIKSLIKKHAKLIKRYHLFVITTGSGGCYVCKNNKIYFVPTVFKNLFDTTGCGDIFFSTFLFFIEFKVFTIQETILLSHIAAGMHGSKFGNENLINKENFFQKIQTIIK